MARPTPQDIGRRISLRYVIPGLGQSEAVGTPVDPTPQVVQEALRAASDAPGYPQTWGTPDLREAVAAWSTCRSGLRSTTAPPS